MNLFAPICYGVMHCDGSDLAGAGFSGQRVGLVGHGAQTAR